MEAWYFTHLTYSWLLLLVGLKEHAMHFAGPPIWESIFFLYHVSGKLGWTPWGQRFFLIFVLWFIPIQTRINHPLGVGHSLGVGYSLGGECKGCCLGGLCQISTLYICIISQLHCSTSLLYKQGYTDEVLGKTVTYLGLGIVLLI